MVKLTKIYTRGGDTGKTSLGDGVRVSKTSARIAAIGSIDEANAVIGLARLYTKSLTKDGDKDGAKDGADIMLARIQNDLFDLGADLARPEHDTDKKTLRITPLQVSRLESEMDALGQNLNPLDSFVLPGGSAGAAHLHHARTVVRRAERAIAALAKTEPVSESVLAYINRLSDHLFQLARHLNANGAEDVLWRPGENN